MLHRPVTESDDLRALGWLRLADGLVKPDLIAVGIHDLESPVAPPLRGQLVRHLHTLLFAEMPEVVLDVCHLEVYPAGLVRGRRVGVGALSQGARKHDARPVLGDGAEVELSVLADHSPHVVEAEGLDVEAPDLVNRLDGDDGHNSLWCWFAHGFAPLLVVLVQFQRRSEPRTIQQLLQTSYEVWWILKRVIAIDFGVRFVQSRYLSARACRNIAHVRHTFPRKPEVVGVDVSRRDEPPRFFGTAAGVGGVYKPAFILHEVVQI